MSPPKSPSLPNTPQFQNDPSLMQAQGLNNRVANFDFSGNLSPLQDTINTDPEVSKLALSYAQNSLNPQFRLNRQNSVNDLANLGALESSTTSNAFAMQDFDLNSQLQAITSGAALEDRNRALNNRTNLFSQGLSNLGSLGLANQSQLNNFNLENYQNIVAKSLNDQKPQNGGFMGGLTGAIGGGLSGFAVGGPWGAAIGAGAGGLIGGFGQPGTGGGLLQAGGGLAGSGVRGTTSSFKTPGQSAGLSGQNGIGIEKLLAQLKFQ